MGKTEVVDNDMRIVIEANLNKSKRGYYAVAYRGAECIARTKSKPSRHDALRELAAIMRERK